MVANDRLECLWSLEENGVTIRWTVTKHTVILLFEIVWRNEEMWTLNLHVCDVTLDLMFSLTDLKVQFT